MNVTVALLLAAVALCARAAPPPADNVAFSPAAGASLPLDARFVDEHGHLVRLGDLVGVRPSIVVPAYYGCSNLCNVVLRAVAASLADSGLRAGRDVEIVAVSIDPSDTAAIARSKKNTIAGANDGWHLLTGNDAAISRFADALGYRYFRDAAQRQYAHASGVAIVAPGGRIAQVLYGATFPRADLLDALAAARTSRPVARTSASVAVAAPEVRTWLLCFHYDPHTGRYSFVAMNAVRAAALAALVALGGCVVFMRMRERSR